MTTIETSDSGMTAVQFSEYAAKARKMSDGELCYAMADLNAVIAVQEEGRRSGHRHAKLGFYHDERHTYGDEIRRRRSGKRN